jgi:hypothetical protein
LIKISFLICSTCLFGWIIFVGVGSQESSQDPTVFKGQWVLESEINSPHPSEEWGLISAITAGIAIASFALSYLGGHIIRRNSGAIRLGVLISVLWVVVSFVVLEPYIRSWRGHSLAEFVGIGIIPVILYWGILWVISGFLPSKNKVENS